MKNLIEKYANQKIDDNEISLRYLIKRSLYFRPTYTYYTKEENINGDQLEAIYVERHGRIDAIAVYSKNVNSNDPWANITKWIRCLYVKYKGEKEWTIIVDEECRKSDIDLRIAGIYDILFRLEDERIKRIKKLRWEYQICKDCLRNSSEELYDIFTDIKRAEKEVKGEFELESIALDDSEKNQSARSFITIDLD